jgi:hypothetical protein
MSDNQKQWLTWIIMVLVSLAIALFFGVQYPLPDQPAEPIEPIELGAHFTNPIDVEGSASASAPALTFEGDTDTGFYHVSSDVVGYASDGSDIVHFKDGTVEFKTTSSISQALNSENVGPLPTIRSATIATDTDGALWQIGDGEIWLVHQVICNVTTNFDCSGDDCILHVGDGNDEDGLLDLDDGELQTSDAEGTGAPTGWQGFMSTDTRGAYVAHAVGFVYAPSGAAETIDVKLEDSSDQSDPSAGAATCYVAYTRLQ